MSRNPDAAGKHPSRTKKVKNNLEVFFLESLDNLMCLLYLAYC